MAAKFVLKKGSSGKFRFNLQGLGVGLTAEHGLGLPAAVATATASGLLAGGATATPLPAAWSG